MSGAAGETVLVTGGTGTVGRFIVDNLLDAGYAVAVARRRAPGENLFSQSVGFRQLDLEPEADHAALMAGITHVVHCAFDHVAGRYRGGEGDDPARFSRLNKEGSIALAEAAKNAGVARFVFLSTRAVYGSYPVGTELREDTPCRPDTLYGEVKLAVERALAAMAAPDFTTASLRVTGVYGAHRPGAAHKWQDLFTDFIDGRKIDPRAGTEVHGRDVAAAVRLMLQAPAAAIAGETFNVSDLLVDRHDLLALVARHTGSENPLPVRADDISVNVMSIDKLQALGWQPGGEALFEAEVARLVSRA